jgi:sugar lactone lactonase YvrE
MPIEPERLGPLAVKSSVARIFAMVLLNLRRFVAACPVLLLAFLNSSGSVHAQTVSFASAQVTVGATGLKSPVGVAADLAGNVYIADSGNNRVVRFPVGGGQQTVLGSGLSAPQGVAVDAAGDVFIADTGNKRVVEEPAGGGAQISLITDLADPLGVAFDAVHSVVYVADYGTGLWTVPPGGGTSTYLAADEEQYVNSVAVDKSGNVFLSNETSFNIANDTYSSLPALQEIPNGCGNFVCVATLADLIVVTGVAVDSNGHVYMAYNGAVLEYSGGAVVGTVGSGIGDAAGVGVDPRGDLFVADSAADDVAEIQKAVVNFGNLNLGATGETVTLNYDITSTGTLGAQNVLTLGASNSDFTLASGSTCTGSVTSGGTCVVKATFTPTAAGLRYGAVQLTDAEGNIATTLLFGTALGPEIAFGPGTQTTISNSLGLNTPDGVAVDGKGDIIIADTFNNRVINLPPKGAFTTIGTGLCEPAGVAVDGAGDVFIADYCNNRVVDVPSGGGAQVTVGSGLNGPKDVAVDGQGDVFVADTGNNRVVEVVPGGTQIVLNVSVASLGLNSPTGVAVNAEGDVLIADTGNNRVVEVETNGVQTTIGSGFNQPTGVAVDGAGSISQSQPGDVYVADYGNQRVVEVPAGGSPQFTIGSGYSGPHGVAVDAAGDLFVADRNDSVAFEFQLSTPDSLSFPTSTPVNKKDSTDGPMAITVEDIGNEPLIIASVSYPTNFLNLPPEEGLGCSNGLGLKTGQSCYVTTEFDPTSVGANTGSIVLTDNALNASGATQSIAASGTGLYDTQTITFNPTVTSYPYTASSFQLSATASSNLAVSFASMSTNICTVSGTTASIVTTGACIVQATQAGNSIFSAATAVSVKFTINPGPQAITFNPAITTYSYAAKSFSLSATSTSGLTVSFASTTTPVCTVSGNTANILAGGICTIQATQSGNTDYAAATPVPVSFTIAPVAQTISFAEIKLPEDANSTLALSAHSTSGLAVSFASKTTTVCTVSGSSARLLIEGTCTIAASQAGNSTYTAAPVITHSFAVSLASQKIKFPSITAKEYADSKLKLDATASSKLAVKYKSETLSVCTVSNGEASLLTKGTCAIKATQPGNDVFAAAKAVPQSFTVLGRSQTISFGKIASQKVGTPLTLTATASSKLKVDFSSTTTSVCTVTGATAKMVAAGNCTIEAKQPGNDVYAAAKAVSQTFTVTTN